MIIERSVADFVVFSEDPLLHALEKISANQARIIFCVSEHGRIEGVLSDGDFRRWVVRQSEVDLHTRVIDVANRSFIAAPITATPAELRGYFTAAFHHLPLVDERGRLVAVAINTMGDVRIGSFTVGARSPALLIAEIGINHNGSVERAKELVDAAQAAGADAVKFQLRDLASLYRNHGTGAALIDGEDLGPQYTLDLLSRFSLDAADLFEVFDHCAAVGIDTLCTPWDLESVDALDRYGVPSLKIASADLTNHELLAHAAATGRPLLVSTGMSAEHEIVESVAVLHRAGAAFALLHCNSTYPAPFKDVNLRYLDRLAQLGDCPVGYSGHERGSHVCIAAVARGAKIIEKHFTLDRSLEGNDHKVSLLPDEFAEMVVRIREVEEALGTSDARVVSPGESMNRVNLAKSLVAAQTIEVGDVIEAHHVIVRSPGRGLQPNARERLIGRPTRRTIEAGEFFYPSDLDDEGARGRSYKFRRPWGLPVRYHDHASLLAQSNPDFLEFHLSYNDVDLDPRTIFTAPLDLDLAVHSPDLFSGDHLLNLATEEPALLDRSLAELQRVIDLTRARCEWFTDADEPVVIASLGGFSHHAHVPARDRPAMYERVAAALDRLDTTGVRLLPQTLPPYPWYLGGQLYCNLFVDADDTAWFCDTFGWSVCLDVSHTKLAANVANRSFREVIDVLAPHAGHLHLVDAAGVDGEGLQIGAGEIDFAVLAEQLTRDAPAAGFIPEIWQGHVNDGEGFWLALERLEAWF
jgi:N-acetylneuraminate synthase